VLSIIFAGWLSDRIGRKPVITSGLLLGALLILPAFWLMEEIGLNSQGLSSSDTFTISFIMLGLSMILGLLGGPQAAILAELFPAKSRNSAATFPHNLAAGWVGGTLPFIISWINLIQSNNLAGLWYPSIFIFIAAILSYFYLPETKT